MESDRNERERRRIAVAMDRRPEQHREHEHRGEDVTITAPDHENCRGEHREQRPAEDDRRERRELAHAPRDHHDEDETEPGDRDHAFAHVEVHGLGRQPEHQAAEPPLPSLLRGLTPLPE